MSLPQGGAWERCPRYSFNPNASNSYSKANERCKSLGEKQRGGENNPEHIFFRSNVDWGSSGPKEKVKTFLTFCNEPIHLVTEMFHPSCWLSLCRPTLTSSYIDCICGNNKIQVTKKRVASKGFEGLKQKSANWRKHMYRKLEIIIVLEVKFVSQTCHVCFDLLNCRAILFCRTSWNLYDQTTNV